MLTGEQIERLEALLAKATPGPWSLHKHSPTTVLASDGYSATNTDSNLFDANARNESNAALMVEAINALPALLQLARAVQSAPRIEVSREDWIDHCDAFGADLIGQTVALVPVPGEEG